MTTSSSLAVTNSRFRRRDFLLFPCYSLLFSWYFRQISRFHGLFLHIFGFYRPPLQGFTGTAPRFQIAKRIAIALAIAAGALFRLADGARAEELYPARPIRLVVGFGAGGPTDIPARFVADKLGQALGTRVVVENKPAAAGMIATRDALSQPRDGYTLLLCTHFEAINTAVYRNAQFKLDDLAPISLIAKYYYGLALANSIPATDFGSFIAYAKSHPDEVSYATVGAGSAQEILARQLERLTGISMNRVPFRGGAHVVQELVAGRVQFY